LSVAVKREHTADVLIIGGGLVGSAVGFGLAERGVRITMLDEGDRAFRAARGNAGLVWYQAKGRGMRRYQEWSLEATRAWPSFAAKLLDLTGIDVAYSKPGGMSFCISDAEYEDRRAILDQIRQEAAGNDYDCRMLDRAEIEKKIHGMKLGDAVIGASYSPHDGHVNPLALMRALHAGFISFGGQYFAEHGVLDIYRQADRYVARTSGGSFAAAKLVIAAGNATGRLASMAGMRIPVRPEKGEILVTERARPCLNLPSARIRQTAEGSFLLGASQEDAGFDVETDNKVIRSIADRARRVFPALGELRIVRTWAALRIKTPDGMPVYESAGFSPQAFAIALHSGVTLAPLHAGKLVDWILDSREPDGFKSFSAGRFNV